MKLPTNLMTTGWNFVVLQGLEVWLLSKDPHLRQEVLIN